MVGAIWIVVLLIVILIFPISFYVRNLHKRFNKLVAENRDSQELISNMKDLLQRKSQRSDADRGYWEAVAVEREQRRLATELHDDTVQRMVAVRFKLEQLLDYPNHPRVSQEVEDLRREIDQIIATLRFLINNQIQPRFQQHSLEYLVKELAEKLGTLHHQEIKLETVSPERAFTIEPPVKQELYYMVHELVHNSLKSSTGFQIIIRMTWGKVLTLWVGDNGQGLGRGRGYGIGMLSLQERAKKINATIDFEKVTRGLSVTIRLPEQQSITEHEGH